MEQLLQYVNEALKLPVVNRKVNFTTVIWGRSGTSTQRTCDVGF